MPIMEISIVPVGTGCTSISDYVALSDEILRNVKDIKSEITAMGTLVESSSLHELFDIAEKMHKKALSTGTKRILTNISIDDRLDKKLSLEGKVESVRKKLEKMKRQKGQGGIVC